MSSYVVHKGDCLDFMDQMISSGQVVDAVVSDVPYLINYRSSRILDKNHKFCSPIANDDCFDFDLWASKVDALLSENAPLYIFGSWKTSHIFKPIFDRYWNHKNTIVWVKNSHTAGDLEAQMGQKYELIYLYNKGRSKIRGSRPVDVWSFDRVSGHKQTHQNEKPVDLMRRIISLCTDKGSMVFDPFMGSGTTGVACANLDRNFVGCEIDEHYFQIASRRISLANGVGVGVELNGQSELF